MSKYIPKMKVRAEIDRQMRPKAFAKTYLLTNGLIISESMWPHWKKLGVKIEKEMSK